jgi:sirohydrochlorin ferrochelatase
MPKPFVLIVGHGSRERRANAQFKALVRRYAAQRHQYDIAYAFLELANPPIRKALERWARSERTIHVLPLFLFAAGHVNRDFPNIFKSFSVKHPSTRIKMTNIVGSDPALARLAMIRALSLKGDPRRTFFLLMGRGSRNKKAQKELGKIAGRIRKVGPFGKVGHCFYDMAEPSLEKALDETALSGFRSVHVMPYLFFNGDLISKLRAKTAGFLRKNKGMTVKVAQPLGIHSILFKAMDRCLRGTRG